MSHDVIVHFPVNFFFFFFVFHLITGSPNTIHEHKHLEGVGFLYCVLGVLESENNSSRNFSMNTVAMFLQELLWRLILNKTERCFRYDL